jgi:farnesyl-diphosphate farnesyltransferase
MTGTAGSDQVRLKTPTKTRYDENFPVASRLIPARLRSHVHAFYLCVRAADDVADDGTRPPAEKTALLTAMDEALQGLREADDVTRYAIAHRESAHATGITIEHARHLLQAFAMDVTKLRYRNWSELINYCLYSAAPVGRYLLDLHGEDGSARPYTDALCIALQILNHLQDCKDDYLNLDRVYIPCDMLSEAGTGVEALAADRSSPQLRAALNRVLARTDELILKARFGPPLIRDRGLRLETAVIVAIAERLSARLKRKDPVAGRVELNGADKALCVARGVWRGLTASR